MSLSIINNVSSLTAQHNLARTSSMLSQSLARLSSGLKVNRGADGPAALVISEQQRAQIVGLRTAIANTNKAVSVVQTGEGALNEISSLLGKIRSLALDSANSGVNDANAPAANQAEIRNALDTINNIAKTTQFGSKHLLDGTAGVTGSSTDPLVQFLTGTENTTAGDYVVSGVTAATRTNATGAVDFSAGLTANETVTINNVNISLANGDSFAAVLGKINDVASQTGVRAYDGGSGKIELVANDFGSKPQINVTGTGAVGADLQAATVNAGTDAAATVTFDPTGAKLAQTTTISGNVITISSGQKGDGLRIQLDVDPTNPTQSTANGATVHVTNGALTFQIGANANQTAQIAFQDARASNLGVGVTQSNGSAFASLDKIDVTTTAGAQDAISVIDASINEISSFRGKLGAFQANTLEANANNLQTTLENTVAAESVIRDTDFAEEMATFTKTQVMMQAGSIVLGNANQIPQLVAALLRG